MEHTKTHNEYTMIAFIFSLLSLIGSCFSVFNMITILTTYQLLLQARHHDMLEEDNTLITLLFQTSIFLTCIITILYTTLIYE